MASNDLNQPNGPAIDRNPRQQRNAGPSQANGAHSALVTWIMGYVSDWRALRNSEHLADWDGFNRLWRGVWAPEDRQRGSERSKMIAPALAEAIDLTHAEIAEAVLGRGYWFAVDEDLGDKEPEADQVHAQLEQDMDEQKVPEAISKALQIGTLYGTGIAKISMESEEYVEMDKATHSPKTLKRICAKVYPLDVREFVPDPSSDCIEDMLGCAHETVWPYHMVAAKQREGYFYPTEVSDTASSPGSTKASGAASDQKGSTFITEWHGLVPASLLNAVMSGSQEAVTVDEKTDEMVEAIVTIANEGILLRAKVNPVWSKDRAIVAYQHETVPTEFWGRGVAEKGINSQRALDATFRMRLDAGALVAAPQVAVDKTRLPRGFNYKVSPGKEWPTTGNPNEIIMPFNLGNTNPQVFQDTNDLSNMVKQATGAFDPGASLSQGSRRDTMGGTAMMAASTVKRARRTMMNIENQFLQPLLDKILRRYVQFAPDRYPADYKFIVKGAMGVMAREFEQSYLSGLYQSTTPEDGPARMLILREIFENSSSTNKEKLVAAIDAQLAPPDEAKVARQKQMEDLQLRALIAEVNLKEAQAANQSAQAGEHAMNAQGTVIDAQLKQGELQMKPVELQIKATEAAAYSEQVRQQAADNQTQTQFKAIELMQKEDKLKLEERKINVQANKPKSGS